MKKNKLQAEEVEQSTYRTGETRGKMQARKHKRLQAEERASPAKSADNVTEKIAWATSGHTLKKKKVGRCNWKQEQ